jgi:hypothetical protein
LAGAAIIGELMRSGIGQAVEVDSVPSLAKLRASCSSRNEALLKQLREDEHSMELLALAKEDAALGRLSEPVPVEHFPVDQFLLHPRFAVARRREDGSVKVRAIDHFSWSEAPQAQQRREGSVNGHTVPAERLGHDTLDALGEAMRQFVRRVGVLPGLVKSDVDAAFRRVPVRADQRWACGIAFRVAAQVALRASLHVSLARAGICRYWQQCISRALSDH